MRNRVTLLFFCLSLCHCFGQGYQPHGARSAAMMHSSLTLTDANSYFNNPGATAKSGELNATIGYENRLLLPEFQGQNLAIVSPLGRGSISAGYYRFGSEHYRNIRTGLGYALSLTEKFSLGVQINYQSLRLPEFYGMNHSITGEIGALLEVNEQWSFAMAVFNLGRAKLSAFQDDRYNTVYRVGTAYEPSKQVKVAVELHKNVDGPLSVRGGLEYEPMDQFFLRLGVGSQPANYAFGFGYSFKSLTLDLTSQYHQTLGWSPQISLRFQNLK
jgi:hypothetical protein